MDRDPQDIQNEPQIISLFWGREIKSGDIIDLSPPENVYTILTNISFGNLPENPIKEPVTLKANVKITHIESIKEGDTEPPVEMINTTLASLIPEKIEQLKIYQVFSPLCQVSFTVDGPYSLDISGRYEPVYSEEEEDIDEEEEEELDEKEIEKKAMQLVNKYQK